MACREIAAEDWAAFKAWHRCSRDRQVGARVRADCRHIARQKLRLCIYWSIRGVLEGVFSESTASRLSEPVHRLLIPEYYRKAKSS